MLQVSVIAQCNSVKRAVQLQSKTIIMYKWCITVGVYLGGQRECILVIKVILGNVHCQKCVVVMFQVILAPDWFKNGLVI